jgi:hypothetical protein
MNSKYLVLKVGYFKFTAYLKDCVKDIFNSKIPKGHWFNMN